MSFKLYVSNPNTGDLVVSSDAHGLYCVGKAALQGSVVQASGSATAGNPGRTWGYSTYRIAHAGPIIAAIDLPLNKRVGIISVTQPLAGTWDILCYCGDTADSYGFDTVQYAIDVWAFGTAQTALDSSIFRIWDSSGNLSHDFSRPNLLFPRAYVLSTGTGVTIPSLTRPVALGTPTSNQSFDQSVGTNHWAALYTRQMWLRTSSTAMNESVVSKQRWEYNAVDPFGYADGDIYNTPCFILEGTTFP